MGFGFSAIESQTFGFCIVRRGRPSQGPPDRYDQWGVSQTAEASGESQWGGLLRETPKPQLFEF